MTREHLRSRPEDVALAQLKALPGIGGFFAQGIPCRGAGMADALTDDPITTVAFTRAYGLKSEADQEKVRAIAVLWRPYRMWTVVLLNVWARSELELPRRRHRQRASSRRSRPTRDRRPSGMVSADASGGARR